MRLAKESVTYSAILQEISWDHRLMKLEEIRLTLHSSFSLRLQFSTQQHNKLYK